MEDTKSPAPKEIWTSGDPETDAAVIELKEQINTLFDMIPKRSYGMDDDVVVLGRTRATLQRIVKRVAAITGKQTDSPAAVLPAEGGL